MSNEVTNQRKAYFDVLRVVATAGVVIFHVAGYGYSRVGMQTNEWNVYSIYLNLSLWPVYIFIMLSGAIFLNRACDIRKLYTHNIFRLIVAYLFWTVLYAVYNCKGSIEIFKNDLVNSHYHLWFVPMMIGVYLLIPILKKIIEEEHLLKYFLCLTFVFSFIYPELMAIVSLINEEWAKYINIIGGKFNFYFTAGFVSYFVLGYYLSKLNIKGKENRIKIISIIIFIGLTVFMAFAPKYYSFLQKTFGDFSFVVLLKSISVFMFARTTVGDPPACSIINKLQKYSFGIYLVHPMVIEIVFSKTSLSVLAFAPILSVPLMSVVVILIAFFIVWIISKMPGVSKYII